MPLVTITSGIGCGGISIAKSVAEGLKTELYDDSRLQDEFIRMGMSSEDLKSLDEKAPGIFNRMLELKPDSYLELLESLVYEISRRGEGVIVGHGSPFLLRDFGCALHVRIYSSEDARVEELVSGQGMNENAARKTIIKSDNEKHGFMHYAFSIDWDDPSLYDLIINRDKLGSEAASKTIIAVAKSDIINECSLQALVSMERFSLKKQVETVIKKNSLNPKELYVDVPDSGVVVITGSINPLESKDKILDAIKAVSGIVKIDERITNSKIHDI